MADTIVGLSKWVTYPLVAVLLSMIGTRLCIAILPHMGLIDLPRGRHQHKKAVPRGGGIAIIVSFFISLGLLYLNISKDPQLVKAFQAFNPFLIIYHSSYDHSLLY